MVGTVIGNYQIGKKIGEGGMGAVYQATDLMLERTVAIKVLLSELTDDPNIVERFRREAKSLARLNHPHINNVYNFFAHNNEYFIVLEYLDGENLEQRLTRESKISYEDAYQIFAQITSALGFAHNQGIVHRDIKPANIMQTVAGNIKVMDFGIARVLGAKALTKIGKAPGSVYYASPEQIRAAENLDARSDIYSLGILLFQLLSGKLPFRGASLPEILQKQLETPAPLISGYLPAVSPVVEAVIKKALAKKAEDRFSTVEDFFRALPLPSNVNQSFSATNPKQNSLTEQTGAPLDVAIQPNNSLLSAASRTVSQPAVNSIPNHIRLTDSRFTVQLEPQPMVLPAALNRPKKSKLGRLIIVLAVILVLLGLGTGAIFYFVVQANLHSFR